jgi:ribosomal-protein-alanine N-acetyltransferase
LSLRPLCPDDVDALHLAMCGQGVLSFFPTTQPPSRARVRTLVASQLEHWREHGFGWWAVEERVSRAFAGWCGLQYLPETDEVEVAYMLGREFWGRGLGTEAATAAVDFGFCEMGLATIVALVHPENVRSRRVIEKLGMEFIEEALYFGMTVRRYVLSSSGTGAGV